MTVAADIGKATITIVPQIDMSGMLENLDAEMRAGVAKHLRALADELSPEKATDEPRYSAVKVNGAWGVADREHPEVWSYWGAYSNAEEYSRRWAGYLNEGARSRNTLDWSTDGMSTDN